MRFRAKTETDARVRLPRINAEILGAKSAYLESIESCSFSHSAGQSLQLAGTINECQVAYKIFFFTVFSGIAISKRLLRTFLKQNSFGIAFPFFRNWTYFLVVLCWIVVFTF